VDDVTLVKAVTRARVVAAATTLAPPAAIRCLIAAEHDAPREPAQPAFRALATWCALADGTVTMPEEARRSLGVADGAEVAVLPLDGSPPIAPLPGV